MQSRSIINGGQPLRRELFTLNAAPVPALDLRVIDAALREAFAATNEPLSAAAQIQVVAAGHSWQIDDVHRFHLRLVDGTLRASTDWRLFAIAQAIPPPVIDTAPPSQMNFLVVAGTTVTRDLRISNQGFGALTVSQITIESQGGYNQGLFTLASPAPVTVPPVQQGNVGSIAIPVSYSPVRIERQGNRAEVVILSNDPVRPEVRIGLFGLAMGPSMVMTPYVLDFGRVGVGERGRQLTTIRNIGDTDLVIEANSFVVVDQPGAAISLHWIIEDGNGAPFPAQQIVLVPGAQHIMWLRFEPMIRGALNGYVLLNNNDPSQRVSLLILNGSGV